MDHRGCVITTSNSLLQVPPYPNSSTTPRSLMAAPFAAISTAPHDTSGGSVPGGSSGSAGIGICGGDGGDDDDCFSIELDLHSDTKYKEEPNGVAVALEHLSSSSEDSHLHGLAIVEESIIHNPEWLTIFKRSDGIGLCVELMGCFSPAPVQRAAARVCNQIAAAGASACEMLLAADVCSMIEQHVKHPNTTFPMFESQAGVIAGIASHPGLAQTAFRELGLMGHLVGILTDSSTDAAPARFAALAAIRALCESLPQAQSDFFYYGGASTVLQSLLQEDCGHDETLAAVSVLQTVAEASDECRDIMSASGGVGIEVLAQVHRDADARGDTALASAATRTLAVLTHRHSLNMETLKNCVKLLGDEGLPKLVRELHMEQCMDTPPRSPVSGMPIKHFSLNISRSLGMSTCSTAMSDGDSPTSPSTRKGSLDGGSSRALSRMGSSMKSMIGSVRKLIRSDRRSCDDQAIANSRSDMAGASNAIDGTAAADTSTHRLCVV